MAAGYSFIITGPKRRRFRSCRRACRKFDSLRGRKRRFLHPTHTLGTPRFWPRRAESGKGATSAGTFLPFEAGCTDEPSPLTVIISLITVSGQRFGSKIRNGRRRPNVATGVQSFPIDPYVIYYELCGSTLNVLRVWHARMDTRRSG